MAPTGLPTLARRPPARAVAGVRGAILAAGARRLRRAGQCPRGAGDANLSRPLGRTTGAPGPARRLRRAARHVPAFFAGDGHVEADAGPRRRGVGRPARAGPLRTRACCAPAPRSKAGPSSPTPRAPRRRQGRARGRGLSDGRPRRCPWGPRRGAGGGARKFRPPGVKDGGEEARGTYRALWWWMFSPAPSHAECWRRLVPQSVRRRRPRCAARRL